MKTLYLFLIGLSLSLLSFGQIPVAWAIKLPADYYENQPERENLKIIQVVDNDILGADNVEAIWGMVPADYVYPLDFCSSCSETMPEQSPEDFTGKFALMAGEDNLYVVLNVIDADWSTFEDKAEIVLAGNVEAVDIDPTTIIADSSTWNWVDGDYQPWYGTKDTIHDMARYGLWSDFGAVKLDGLISGTTDTLNAGTMFYDPVLTNNNQLDGNPNFGSTSEKIPLFSEAQTGGYLQLIVLPWSVMDDNGVSEIGDQMSIAVRVQDNTPDADSTYVYWGGASDNNAFWAPTFYGARAELIEMPVSQVLKIKNDVDVYIANDVIFYSKPVSNITLYSITGSVVEVISNPGLEKTGLPNLNQGIYIARVNTSDGSGVSIKFVKK